MNKIYSKTVGKGRPVVMLHGYGLDHSALFGSMEPIFKKHRGFKRVYCDLPAMGHSPVMGVKSSKDILNRIMKFILDNVQDQKFIIVGYSYGAYLAQHIALRKPNLIDGMLLIAPVVFAEASKRKIPRYKVLVKKYSKNNLKTTDEIEIFDNLVIQTKSVWDKAKKYILSGYRIRKAPILERIQERAYPIPGNILRLKQKITVPVTIITGKCDSMVGYADSRKILKNYSNINHVVISRAGHNLQIEQPTIFKTIVKKWIGELSSDNYSFV